MAKKIESYNASYPAAFYEIGTVYSFYGNTNSKGVPAKSEYITRYSSELQTLEGKQNSAAIQPVKASSKKNAGGRADLERFYAIIVSKTATNIEIMFLNEDNGKESYLTRKYAVSKSCNTDGKNLMPPTTKTNISGVKGDVQNVGGITKVRDNGGSGRVGGITKANHTIIAPGNVGGITRMEKKSLDDAPSTESNQAQRVGGITRMKK